MCCDIRCSHQLLASAGEIVQMRKEDYKKIAWVGQQYSDGTKCSKRIENRPNFFLVLGDHLELRQNHDFGIFYYHGVTYQQVVP